jgi:hypothetical protein
MNLSPPRTTSPDTTRNARRTVHPVAGVDRPRRAAVSADAVVSAYVNEIARPHRRPTAAGAERGHSEEISAAFAEPVLSAEMGEDGPTDWTWTRPRRAVCVA